MVITSSGVVIRQSRQSFWQRRTKFERFAIISLPICIILLLILTIHLLLMEKSTTIKQIESLTTTEDGVCLTPGCIQAAAETLKFIDQSIDPCDNFYEFACGGYLKTVRIPDNETKINMFIDLNTTVQNQLRSILEEPIRVDEPKSYTLYKSMYSACMNTTAIDLDSINFLKTMIKDLGGWPVLEEFAWNDKKFDWQKSIYKFRKFGLSTNNFITFSVVPNPKNSSKNILRLEEPNLELNREHLLNGVEDEIVQAYINYMVELAQHFGANQSYAQSEVLEIIYFKIKLAQIGVVIEQEQEQKQNQNLTMTIRELQEMHPDISWLDIINYVVSLPDQALKYENLITIENPHFIANLEALLRETPKRVQANHAIFQAITSLVFTLPESIRNLERKFNREIHGTSSVLPRWKECVAISSTSLNLVAASLYVHKYFNETSKHIASELVTNIKKEFIKSFQNLEWIDNDTKKLAIEKFVMMRINVGYSKEYLNLNKIEDYYSDLKINTTNYLLFVGNFSLFKTDQVFSELFDTIDESDWTTRLLPTEVNISYSLRKNSIDIPAAILQKSFFKTDRIQSMNYGAIGSMAGHEISHGFDIEGKRYDKNGKLHNWWKKTTEIAYTKKMNCFINQYSNFTEPEVNINLNGKNTQTENVADNAGIKHAYLAYQTWVKQNGEEPRLPGLNYSAQQIFWISAAHTWCNKEHEKSLKQSILHDDQSPGKFRVMVSFSNSEFFSEDFSCPLGSNMNPHKKCKIW